tara:strand:+ start:1706 stop:3049 length:1344 start_codon:yes stop_codon:yes gene_type:complete
MTTIRQTALLPDLSRLSLECTAISAETPDNLPVEPPSPKRASSETPPKFEQGKTPHGWMQRTYSKSKVINENNRRLLFIVENPAHGKLWTAIELMNKLYHPMNNTPVNYRDKKREREQGKQNIKNAHWKLQETSYCMYGTPYNKPTSFYSNFSLHLKETCRAADRCDSCKQNGGTHKEVLVVHRQEGQPAQKTVSQEVKNSIPGPLINQLLEDWCNKISWMRPNPKRILVFIDVFGGYGSIGNYISDNKEKYEEILYYYNDIVTGRYKDDTRTATFSTHDMTVCTLNQLFWVCMRENMKKIREIYDIDIKNDVYSEGTKNAMESAITLPTENDNEIKINNAHGNEMATFLRKYNVSVLFHLSTPCQTYSPAAGPGHRHAKCTDPHSDLGKSHDAMNTKLLLELLILEKSCDDIEYPFYFSNLCEKSVQLRKHMEIWKDAAKKLKILP